ncbi:hypothetical protein AHMF7605_22700 [Adhaeribacter arboris]|uniref:Uncharacterized protein n=1 Tax=Adhaeribacter arboris TaxID=2072846 RepID=A0A2T2YKT3_9BACT|nr:hypothetical protein [Adhaeribacter arboris]PSR56111.1 hypothetical protein AHMF7605_22700 [Adhaeribacter arboris]
MKNLSIIFLLTMSLLPLKVLTSTNAFKKSSVFQSNSITNLSYLKNKQEIIYFNYDELNKRGNGILKNRYIFQVKPWNNEDEYGITFVSLTTNSKKEILGNEAKVSEYKAYLEAEIRMLTKILLKDKIAIQVIESSIASKKGKFNLKNGIYSLITDGGNYDEISVQVMHFDYYSDLITISCRAVN